MKVYKNITEVFGNTPLVQLNRMTNGAKANVFAKLEFYNPTSTVKDRIGIAMVDAAEKAASSNREAPLLKRPQEIPELHSPWWAQLVATKPS